MTDSKSGAGEEQFFSAGEGIDVNAIMAEIKDKIDGKVSAGVLKAKEITEIEEMEMLPLPDFQEIPHVYQNHLYPESMNRIGFEPEGPGSTPLKKLIKKLLSMVRRVVMPVLRYMIRPVTDETRKIHVDRHNELRPITFQSKEYIKLIHNALNNMVTESSKLKIENDLLKTRMKVLEDKIEFVERRQRAIEKRQFDQ